MGQCHGWIAWVLARIKSCLGATIVEQDPYLTYLDDQWTPTADGQNMT